MRLDAKLDRMRHHGQGMGKAIVFLALSFTRFVLADASTHLAAKAPHRHDKQHISFLEILYKDKPENPTIKSLVQARLRLQPLDTKAEVPHPKNASLISASRVRSSHSGRKERDEPKELMFSRHRAMIFGLIISFFALVAACATSSMGGDAKGTSVPKLGAPEIDAGALFLGAAPSTGPAPTAASTTAVVGRPKRCLSNDAAIEAGPMFFAMDADEHLPVDEDESQAVVLGSPTAGANGTATGKAESAGAAAAGRGATVRGAVKPPKFPSSTFPPPAQGAEHVAMTPGPPIYGLTPRILACEKEQEESKDEKPAFPVLINVSAGGLPLPHPSGEAPRDRYIPSRPLPGVSSTGR